MAVVVVIAAFQFRGSKISNAVIVKVVYNGRVVRENAELTGLNRGGFAAEKLASLLGEGVRK